jgi:segregation and condensation protein B
VNSEKTDDELAQDGAIAASGPEMDSVCEEHAAEETVETSREALAEAAGSLGLDVEGLPAEAPLEEVDEDTSEVAVADVESADSDAPLDSNPEEEVPEPEPKEEVPELTTEEVGMLGKVLFALLFASPEPLSMGRLKDLTESPTQHVRAGLDALEELIGASELPLILRSIAGGFRLFSAPEVADVVTRLSKVRKSEQISPAALETLAIVAYRQPTTKAEVEAIRGVQAGPMLRGLIDRGLVKVTGRADQPGSPLQYGTTREFLDRFGLENLKELPRDNELAKK